MSRAIRAKYNFNQGEVSPLLYSRADIDKYANALKTLTNGIPLIHGPVRRRNGTQFIAEVKDSTKQVRLIPFRYSLDTMFILEFGQSYIRFYTNKAQVQSGGSPLEIVSPYSASELDDVQFEQFGSTLYLTHPDYMPRKLVRNSDVDWDLTINYTYPPPTDELGYSPATDVTPSATTGFGINFTTSTGIFLAGDVGRQIVNTTKGELGRASIVSITSTTIAVCDIVEDFTDTNAIASGDWFIDLSPVSDLTSDSLVAGAIANVTADISASTTAQDTFRAADIGKYILMQGGVLQIIQVNSASDIDCEVIKSLTTLDETGNWTLEEETWSATRGYPAAVGMFEQRLIFGGSKAEPASLWFSETGIFDGFGVGPNDADSIDVDIVAAEINKVEWIASGRDLVVGTPSGEVTISGSSSVLAPSTVQSRIRTDKGSSSQNIVTADSEIIFVQKSGEKIRTFVYNFDVDGYKAEDLLFLAEHLTTSSTTIVDMAYSQEPESLIYAVLSTGDLLIGVFDRSQKVLGWSKNTTDGTFERVATISHNGVDEVWTVVNRTINGNTVRYIEVFDSGDGTSNTDGFSDSFLTYSGVATTTFTGLAHLEGEVVQVKANGAAHADKTVSGGSITLDVSATDATVGLKYTTTIVTVDEDFNVGRGSMLGQQVSWVEPILRVYQSTIPTLDGQEKPHRTPDMEMDNPVDLFTGDLQYSRVNSPRLTITEDGPFPLIITGIFGIVEGDA